MKIKLCFFLLLFFSANTFSETEETNRLAPITKDLARCADVLLGNFENEKDSKAALKTFYSKMIENVTSMVELEKNSGKTKRFLEIMPKQILIGFILRSFVDIDQDYQTQKQSLYEQYDWDWKKVNRELWSKQGCNAIYGTINSK